MGHGSWSARSWPRTRVTRLHPIEGYGSVRGGQCSASRRVEWTSRGLAGGGRQGRGGHGSREGTTRLGQLTSWLSTNPAPGGASPKLTETARHRRQRAQGVQAGLASPTRKRHILASGCSRCTRRTDAHRRPSSGRPSDDEERPRGHGGARDLPRRVQRGLWPAHHPATGEPKGEMREGGPYQKARKASGLLGRCPSLLRRHEGLLRRPEGF